MIFYRMAAQLEREFLGDANSNTSFEWGSILSNHISNSEQIILKQNVLIPHHTQKYWRCGFYTKLCSKSQILTHARKNVFLLKIFVNLYLSLGKYKLCKKNLGLFFNSKGVNPLRTNECSVPQPILLRGSNLITELLCTMKFIVFLEILQAL